jgi:hypothetical protein
MIVWEQTSGGFSNIYNAFYDESGIGWSAAALLENLDVDAWEPQIASDGAGNFMAVWVQGNAGSDSIFGVGYDGSWGSALSVESMSDDASIPQVAANSAGKFMVVWAHDDGGMDDIWARSFNVGTDSLGSLELVDARTNDADTPQVAGGSDNFIAVWSQGDGVNESIFASLFE